MKSLKQYIKEGSEADLIGLLKSFGAGDIEIDDETMTVMLRKKQQVWDITARLPAWTDYDVFVYEINPATAGKSLENPGGTDNSGVPYDHEEGGDIAQTYTDDEIGYEDLTDQFHEYELVIYLYNTESEMVEEGAEQVDELWDMEKAKKGAEDYKNKTGKVKMKHGTKTISIDAGDVKSYEKRGWKLVEAKDQQAELEAKKKKEKKEKDDIEAAESDQGQDTDAAGTNAEYESNELDGDALTERRRIIKVNAKGQRRVKIKCKPGYKFADGKCVKITGSEKTKKRRSIKKAVRTKKQKGSGFQRKVQRLRKRAMKKRKSMGLNSGYDITAKMPQTHSVTSSHEPHGTMVTEGVYKVNAKIDTKKTEIVYKVPSKDGKSTFVTIHVPNKKAGEDKYEMYTVDKGFSVILSHGTHPSLEGAKKMAKARGLAEEVEQIEEAMYPKGNYGAKTRGNAKAQWMRSYEQELSNRKDYDGNAGKIDWNVATHNFFMGVDAKIAAETVKAPYKN